MTIEYVDEARPGGVVPGLRSPFPLRTQVPSMLQEDPLLCSILDGLDDVIAPVISSLDCFDSYLDPKLAPIDMVKYLGSWVLATIDDQWNEPSIRRDVKQAAERAKWAGTARALHDRLVPHEVQALNVVDPGYAVSTSRPSDPDDWGDMSAPVITLRVVPRERSDAERARIERVARGIVPAHVGVTVEFGR